MCVAVQILALRVDVFVVVRSRHESGTERLLNGRESREFKAGTILLA